MALSPHPTHPQTETFSKSSQFAMVWHVTERLLSRLVVIVFLFRIPFIKCVRTFLSILIMYVSAELERQKHKAAVAKGFMKTVIFGAVLLTGWS
jgi:hypothetical protein